MGDINENTLPEGWREVCLGDVCDIESGGTPSTKNTEYWNGEISWITPKDLSKHQYKYISKGERCITEKGLINSSAKLLPKNTILFSSRAPIGYITIAENKLTTNQGFKNIICDEINSHYNYFYYYMSSIVLYVEKLSSGSTFSEISASVLKSIKINLPLLNEQKKIANLLSSFDNKIELLEEQNKTLEEIAQTIFKEWFGKYQLGDELPEGWRNGKLGDEFDIKIGRTPPRKEEKWFSNEENNVRWISIKDIVNSSTFINSTAEFLTREAIEQFNIPLIPKNTVILSFKMTVGKLAITLDEMVSNEAIAQFRLKNNTNINTEYIYLFLKNYNFNALGSTSSIVTAINSKIIKNIEFLIPEYKLLKDFEDTVSPLFYKLKKNTNSISILKQTKDKLLPKLMNGSIRL